MAAADVDVPAGGDSKWLEYPGPKPGTKYPLRILYCAECDDWPVEYLEFYPNQDKAKKWMADNLTDEMKDLYLAEPEGDDAGGEGEKKKRQTRGGKGRGNIKTKAKKEVNRKVCLSRASRGKKKYVTVVTGLATYDIDLKVASKFFGSRFACGSSVTGADEIVIQGDVKDDLFDVIPEKWSSIDEDSIDDLGDQKRA